MNIGIVGTGLMGSQIALRLAHKGHKVTVFNRDKSKAEKLRSANSTLGVANQPSDIGCNCDIALICSSICIGSTVIGPNRQPQS